MSDPLLNVMKIMLLAGLYLFFIRVLWSVYNELRDPRTTVARTPDARAPEVPVAHGVPAMAGAASTLGAPPAAPYATAGAAPTAAPAPAPSLSTMVIGQIVVVEPAEQAGLTWTVDGELTLGRSPENSIQLNDTYVSGHHARFFAHNGDFFIEDLGSRNGTLLNEQPLTDTQRLVVGDRIAVGATQVEFS